MDSGEALDRELVVERAEELRGWLAGFGLSSRAAGALERELSGIIANDPGGYINGQRPLAGLTVPDFVTAVHSRNGGAVGRVKSVGDAVLTELRAAIPTDSPAAAPGREAPELEAPELEAPELEAPELEAPTAAEPEGATVPPRRGRGRPKGSKSTRNGVARAIGGGAAAPDQVGEAPLDGEPQPRRRGRPRRDEAAAKVSPQADPSSAQPAAPVAPAGRQALLPPQAPRSDAALDQLTRLWPALHPHARRAIVLYASALLAEAEHQG